MDVGSSTCETFFKIGIPTYERNMVTSNDERNRQLFQQHVSSFSLFSIPNGKGQESSCDHTDRVAASCTTASAHRTIPLTLIATRKNSEKSRTTESNAPVNFVASSGMMFDILKSNDPPHLLPTMQKFHNSHSLKAWAGLNDSRFVLKPRFRVKFCDDYDSFCREGNDQTCTNHSAPQGIEQRVSNQSNHGVDGKYIYHTTYESIEERLNVNDIYPKTP